MTRIILNILSLCTALLVSAVLSFCFIASGYAMDVTLQWDANTEPDLAGYKVYYKTGSSGEPYDGTGADQGSSPITVPIGDLADSDNPEYTLTGLTDDVTYFFVVTAYDDQERESAYSNEVSTLGVPSITSTSADDGGCFIATAAFGSNMDRYVQILRKFRDNRLLTNRVGRVMVDLYYQFSPPGAVSDGLKVYWSHDLRQL